MSAVHDAARRAGLTDQLPDALTEERVNRLLELIDLRAGWSRTHNLSGPRALALIGTDLADALAVWSCHDGVTPLLDVGSGSGVPGLMVACLNPNLSIHLVEPIAKRCAFMRTAAHRLGLSKARVHRGRWPSPELDALGEVIPISRAVVSPEEWPPLAQRPHLSGMMQMLALQRPEWPLEGYELSAEVRYFDPEGGERLVRRWVRSDEVQ